MEKNGWIFHVSHGDQFMYASLCGDDTWFGFYAGGTIGSISTIFKRSGLAKLNFGNCWTNKKVTAYLNHRKLAYASGREVRKEISFNFTTGDTLRLEEDGGIIKINSLIISCTTRKLAFAYIYIKHFQH